MQTRKMRNHGPLLFPEQHMLRQARQDSLPPSAESAEKLAPTTDNQRSKKQSLLPGPDLEARDGEDPPADLGLTETSPKL
ncbi:uncharacterized protein B0I36DRAFT_334024 [Microdochium trichocladiopsis]|uniref:Uncharacterized protein n=1 Tax=Microdochium trichocladiopsis TaxID=1682393 RepID=A0A9P9BKG5_9PEZI|nr:uncharacterized protein B0I36DRAFT_334024 [Microdochium trichocladiopsis]KAH7021209.1 hypothetical protein B0I36DRAFT_334024 [Microdochium trichocladiopsis]